MNSGGGDGRTEYSWNPTMQKYWQGDEENPGGYLGVANSEFWKNYGDGYQTYGSDKAVEGLDRNQDRGIDEIYNMSMNPSEYMPDVSAGRQQNTDTAQGKYLNSAAGNPWAGVGNEYAGAENKYSGDSPYFREQMKTGMQDITDRYNEGTAQQTNAMMNMSGVLGGGDHQKAVEKNQQGLARELGNYSNQMQQGQYDRSANLEDARLSRAGNLEDARIGRGFSGFEGERGRMLQGASGGLQGQGLSMDLFNNLIQSGGVRRQAGQQARDFDWQEHQNKQNYGRNQLDWMGNYLSRAQGGIGGQVNMYGGGGSSLGQGLGTAMMGYGMFRG